MTAANKDRPLPSGEPRGRAAWAGLLLAVPAALLVYFALPQDDALLTHRAKAAAAIAALLGTLWVTEAIPLAATSLLPLILFPLASVLTFKEASAPYANYNVYIYLGGFIIALAIERWGLHRRVALHTLLIVGTSPARLVGGIMVATALISMWISNTATTAMMLPLGLSLVALFKDHADKPGGMNDRDAGQFAVCMMLGIAYAATIGGLGTLIGTPTNVVFAGVASEKGLHVGFAQWMGFAIPLVAAYLLCTWLLLTKWMFPVPHGELADGQALVRRQLKELGPFSRGEIIVLCVFLCTAALWIGREPLQKLDAVQAWWPKIGEYSNDGIVALLGAVALFMIPVYPRRGIFAMDWETCKRIPWGVLLLFGAGLSLAEAVEKSELAKWIGEEVAQWGGVSMLALVIAVTATVIFASEFTSNVATVAAFLPIMFSVSQGLGADPLVLMIATTVAASYAFMLPVGTPPNAIAFGTGYVKQSQMMRAGFCLNLLGVVLIPLAVYTLGVWVLGIRT